MGKRLIGLRCAVALLSIQAAGFGQTYDQGPVFSITEENDFPANRDRHYTQGLKVSFLHADGKGPDWAASLANALAIPGLEPGTHKFGYSFGQSIFSPENERTMLLVPDDRPYAGWLYAGLILQRRGLAWERWPALDHFELNAGVVGSYALAEEAQDFAHEFTNDRKSAGWDNQLKNEPGLALKYQRSLIISPGQDGPRYFDMIPHVGLSLGNVDTSLRAGGMLRLGWNLPDDFGPQTIDSLMTAEGGWSPSRATGRAGVYLFAGAEGRMVLYNMFLDGNLFHDSHHVDKKLLVAEVEGGIGVVFKRCDLLLGYVLRTREFELQDHSDAFASAQIKFKL